MNGSRTWIATLSVAAAAGVVIWYAYRPAPHAAAGRTVQSTSSNRVSVVPGDPANVREHDLSGLPTEPTEPTVRFHGNQTLATVNGVAITPHDLAPVAPGLATAELRMPAASYRYLLDRAINRELAFQEATARGVGLTEDQHRQLERLRERAETRDLGSVEPVLARPNEPDAEQQTAFDVRDAAGLLLQGELLAAAGGPASPHVTESQVRAYYDAQSSRFGALPAEPEAGQRRWREVDALIRRELAAPTQAAYQQSLADYLARLRGAGRVEVTPLP